jgi:hypothetical protein
MGPTGREAMIAMIARPEGVATVRGGDTTLRRHLESSADFFSTKMLT